MSPKNVRNYGEVCGKVYFLNTFGTFIGSVAFAYLALYWINLDDVFRIVIFLMAFLSAVAVWYQFKTSKFFAIFFLVSALVFAIVVKWDRTYHAEGLFRQVSVGDRNFKGIFPPFQLHPSLDRVLFLRDDPNVTVAVNRRAKSGTISIVNNGKSDGHVTADYSTMTLAGTIPYLLSSKSTGLVAEIIGLGTGVSAGILGKASGVREVRVLEMSPAVIEASPLFDPFNGNVSKNEKIKLLQTDAFRHFTRTSDKIDVIMSEPSNPWVTGVENLFSEEFYDLVKDRLSDDGVFLQWVQLYEIDNESIASIFRNVLSRFEFVEAYQIGPSDLGLIVSKRPINWANAVIKFGEPALKAAHLRMIINQLEDLSDLRVFNRDQLAAIVSSYPSFSHSIYFPKLAHHLAPRRFLSEVPDLSKLLDQAATRMTATDVQARSLHFERRLKDVETIAQNCRELDEISSSYCVVTYQLLPQLAEFKTASVKQLRLNDLVPALKNYSTLRDSSVLLSKPSFFQQVERVIINSAPSQPAEDKKMLHESAALLLAELINDQSYAEFERISKEFADRSIISKDELNKFNRYHHSSMERLKILSSIAGR